MFTIQQIHDAFAKVKSGADFPQFVQDLKALGIHYYENYVADGSTQYIGANGFSVTGEAKYTPLAVTAESSAEALKNAITIHQQGATDYPTFCEQAAQAGVEKWTTHMLQNTVTYYNQAGEALLVEPIPQP